MSHCPTDPARWTRTGILLLSLAVLSGAAGASAQPDGELRLLQRIPLPIGKSIPTDLRWASRDSVYLSVFTDGVAEVGLDGAVRRTLAPGARTLELNNYTNLAASPGRLAVSSAVHSLVWRTVRPKAGGSFLFHRQRFRDVYDFDIFDDRVLLLGLEKAEPGATSPPQGAIAWIGRLSEEEELADLKPVLHDPAGPGAPRRPYRSSYTTSLQAGSVRRRAITRSTARCRPGSGRNPTRTRTGG